MVAMSADVTLHGFAYGEHLDGLPPRSLGYRLLAPPEPQPWSAEVEALARLLHAAPYPDHWPATDLFCSVLLADGSRLIAVARYGLSDQTTSHRRGGLELFGVIGPAALSPAAALTVYHWLRKCRARAEDLRSLSGRYPLADVLAEGVLEQTGAGPAPVLPVRLWQDGVLLFSAATASDPDRHLTLLAADAPGGWQWLPLVGPDFPFAEYARRGPLAAWTPHLTGLAVKLDRAPAERIARAPRQLRSLVAAFGTLVLLLLVANLWATLALRSRLLKGGHADLAPKKQPDGRRSPEESKGASDEAREVFARALYRLMLQGGAGGEFKRAESRYLKQYQSLVAGDKDLAVDSKQGKTVVTALHFLARRRIDRIVALIREALPSRKGYDSRLVEVACQRVREKLRAGLKVGP
jgi:hypothetical protein